MDLLLLRMFMHLAGFMMAAVVAWVLPFSIFVNLAIAAGVFMFDAIISEIIFARLAVAQQRAREGRGRMDDRV